MKNLLYITNKKKTKKEGRKRKNKIRRILELRSREQYLAHYLTPRAEFDCTIILFDNTKSCALMAQRRYNRATAICVLQTNSGCEASIEKLNFALFRLLHAEVQLRCSKIEHHLASLLVVSILPVRHCMNLMPLLF